MKRSTGLLILVALGALDIFWLVSVPFLDTPVPVGIIGGVLGIVTLAAARPAWGGNRAATIAVLATRVLSALVLDLPAYFFDDTPGWASTTRQAGRWSWSRWRSRSPSWGSRWSPAPDGRALPNRPDPRAARRLKRHRRPTGLTRGPRRTGIGAGSARPHTPSPKLACIARRPGVTVHRCPRRTPSSR
jgi:hypothetical protein